MTDLRKAAEMALEALKISTPVYSPHKFTQALKALEAALAQPEQEEPLPLVDIGVDVTPEGTHVVACYNRPDAVQEMFYSQFHPLTKPEQEPKLSDAGADTNISRGLEPKGSGMVTLNQPVAWMDSEGRFSYFKGSDEDAPLYSAPPNLAQPEQFVVSFPSFMRKRIEQALKDAIHPTGMSVHDGKVKVLVSDLHRMLLVIDSTSLRKEDKNDGL